MDVTLSVTGFAGVKDILNRWKERDTPASPLKRLEMALEECRAFLRELGRELARQRRARETKLCQNLQSLLLQVPVADKAQLSGLQVQIDDASQKLQHLEESIAQGHKIRAGLKWELEGDRPFAFFFQKMQEQRAKKTMEELLDREGNPQRGLKEMKSIVEKAYEEIFQSTSLDEAWQRAWEEHKQLIQKKVSQQQQVVMDTVFTEDEILEALQELPVGKSPGHDGITKEFMLAF